MQVSSMPDLLTPKQRDSSDGVSQSSGSLARAGVIDCLKAEPQPPRPLRIGLMIDSTIQPRWRCKIIDGILSSSFATIAVVIKNDRAERDEETWVQKLSRAVSGRQQLLYKLYTRLDDAIFRSEPDAFKTEDIQTRLSGCPLLRIKPLEKGFSDYFSDQEVEAIREYQLDVALRFGFRILRGDALRIAKYGIWSYHHGDNNSYRGGPPGFWEVMEGNPATGAILQILTEELDNGKVIYRSVAPTDKRSVRRNKNNYYWQATEFVTRKLRDVYHLGSQAVEDDPSRGSWQPYSSRLYKAPSNWEMVKCLGALAKRYVAFKKSRWLSREQWFVAYKLNRDQSSIDNTYYRFKKLIPPKDRFWADPFPIKDGNKYYVFIEEYVYSARKGHISVLELDHKGIIGGPRKVLEAEHHLSYPFVFSWNGNRYMIPESSASGKVELYRCISFPDQWVREKVLLDGVYAVDTTIHQVNDLWWMFTAIKLAGTLNVFELHLFYADTPLGPWHGHLRNPVKTDIRSLRPAGTLFCRNGALYRPAQDCSDLYGHAISVNRITRLDKENFEEQEVSRIWPKWAKNLERTHTINSAEGLTVIDGLMLRHKLALDGPRRGWNKQTNREDA
jgi:hypothetical protein